MQQRGRAAGTQASYVPAVCNLSRYYRRSPDRISDADLKANLPCLMRERHHAPSNLTVEVSALRFFYGCVLRRPTEAIEHALPRMKKPVARARIYSPEQISRLFHVEELSLKHRAMLLTTYTAGLRVSEDSRLRPGDIGIARRHPSG